VDKSFQSLLSALRTSNARIIVSHTEDVARGQRAGYLDFEIPRAQVDSIEKELAASGETVDRSLATNADAENVTDSKVQFKLKLNAAAAMPPREMTGLAIEVPDVDAASQNVQSLASKLGGRVIDSNTQKDVKTQTARVIIEVPYSASTQLVTEAKQLGKVRGSQQSTNQQAPAGELARARLDVTFASGEALLPPENGVFATIRKGLATSFTGLMISLQFIIIGLCFVGPWVLLIWLTARWIKRSRQKPVTL
jgi:hypothetical protein